MIALIKYIKFFFIKRYKMEWIEMAITSSISPSASQPPPRIGWTSWGMDELPSIVVIKPFPQKAQGVPFKGQNRQTTPPFALNWSSSLLDWFRVKQNLSGGKRFGQERKDLGLELPPPPPMADPPSALGVFLYRRHKRKIKMKISRSKTSSGKEIA